MNTILHILFWTCLFLLAYTYILFPLGLNIRVRFSRRKSPPSSPKQEPLPFVSVIIPAYNEESIIEKKIHSVYQSDYSNDRLEVLVMSDASTDQTDEKVIRQQQKHPSLHFYRSEQRIGKPSILNHLATIATGEILLLTDANVMLSREAIRLLARHFSDPELGLADTQLITVTNHSFRGIAFQEKKYTGREVMIKYKESLLWGIMMGPSGACYALRKNSFSTIPSNFLVDDFYINMKVLEQGRKAIVEPKAIVYEDVTHKFTEAFRRKVRIAAGNFQNFYAFRHLFSHILKPTGFCFWSHKGIRWFGPWLILLNLVSNILLAIHEPLYLILLSIHLFIFFLITLDNILGLFGKQIVILRFITHFYSMNLALAAGLIKVLKGVKTNVWEPTERNQ